MNEIFEIVVPYLSSDKQTPLSTKLYSSNREYIKTFIKQHNLKIFDVNVYHNKSDVESANNRKFDESDYLLPHRFTSNYDGKDYTIITSESLIIQAVDYIAEKVADNCIFGDAILRTDIPIIDIINRLLEKIDHVVIFDYLLLDTSLLNMDEVIEHYKHYTNIAYSFDEDAPDECDRMYDFVFDSFYEKLPDSPPTNPEPITIEGYVEYIATWLTDSI